MASNLQIIINGVDNASGAFGDVGDAMTDLIDNSQRNTSHVWNVTIPTAGGNQPADQMQSMFNTLTTIYAG